MGKSSQKEPKTAKKGQNNKTPATAITLATHQKYKRKCYLEEGQNPFLAIFGQKVPKKSRFGILRALFGMILQIWDQISKALIFLYWKMALIFGFGVKFKKRFFLPEKNLFDHFSAGFYFIAWAVYGLNLRDLSQASGIWCKNQISGVQSQLDILRPPKNGKNQKTVLPDTFFWFDSFQHTK